MSNRQPTPEALMVKAETACSSARALLELGDADGAVPLRGEFMPLESSDESDAIES